MINNDLTPIPVRFKYLKGATWRFFVTLSDLSEQLNLNNNTVSALITYKGNVVKALGVGNGIAVSNDGKTLDIKYDFITVTQSNGETTVSPPLSAIPSGEYRLQLLISRTDGRDSSPIFFYVDVADEPSDSDVDRLVTPQIVEITLDQGVRVATEVVPVQDRIEWKNEAGLISVRYIGETNWAVWADFTGVVASASSAQQSATSASNSATSASQSATQASQSATNASNSATQASQSATNASNSATQASQSATNASNSATSASTSATQAAASAQTVGDVVNREVQILPVKASVAMGVGTPVYISGADGTNIVVSPASSATEATSSKVIGLLMQSLALNGQGSVVTGGKLAGLNTSSATLGDPVWLGSTAGTLIFGLANKPVAPQHLVYLGVVSRVHATNGEITVRVQNGFEIDELHDVLITNKQDGDIVQFDSASGLWKNTQSIETRFGSLARSKYMVEQPIINFQPTVAGQLVTYNNNIVSLTVQGVTFCCAISDKRLSSIEMSNNNIWLAIGKTQNETIIVSIKANNIGSVRTLNNQGNVSTVLGNFFPIVAIPDFATRILINSFGKYITILYSDNDGLDWTEWGSVLKTNITGYAESKLGFLGLNGTTTATNIYNVEVSGYENQIGGIHLLNEETNLSSDSFFEVYNPKDKFKIRKISAKKLLNLFSDTPMQFIAFPNNIIITNGANTINYSVQSGFNTPISNFELDELTLGVPVGEWITIGRTQDGKSIVLAVKNTVGQIKTIDSTGNVSGTISTPFPTSIPSNVAKYRINTENSKITVSYSTDGETFVVWASVLQSNLGLVYGKKQLGFLGHWSQGALVGYVYAYKISNTEYTGAKIDTTGIAETTSFYQKTVPLLSPNSTKGVEKISISNLFNLFTPVYPSQTTTIFQKFTSESGVICTQVDNTITLSNQYNTFASVVSSAELDRLECSATKQWYVIGKDEINNKLIIVSINSGLVGLIRAIDGNGNLTSNLTSSFPSSAIPVSSRIIIDASTAYVIIYYSVDGVTYTEWGRTLKADISGYSTTKLGALFWVNDTVRSITTYSCVEKQKGILHKFDGSRLLNQAKANGKYVMFNPNSPVGLELADSSETRNFGNVVIYGDSIVANGATFEPQKLGSKIKATSIQSFGYGGYCYGSGGAGTLANQQKLDTLIATNPNYLFLQAGTNDFGNSVMVGQMDSSILTETSGGLNYIINYLQTNLPSCRIIIETPTPRYYVGSAQYTPNSVGKTLLDYVNAIEAVAVQHSIPVLNNFKLFGVNRYNHTQYFNDGLHFLERGYDRITDLQASFLKNL